MHEDKGTTATPQIQKRVDIAVIGMAGKFPGANNINEFWNNLTKGVDSLRTFTEEELIRCGVSTRLAEEYKQVTGNVLISAGLMAYLGPFTSEFRSDIIMDWVSICKERQIPCADKPSLVRTLGDPVAIRQWQMEGLLRL